VSANSLRLTVLLLCLALPAVLVAAWGASAGKRLHDSEGAASKVAVASVSDDAYCTANLKAVVRRVAGACGLVASGAAGRGCQPMQAKKVASLSGNDFNAMFKPLAKRAHIVQFDLDKAELDAEGKALVEKAWADQRGASFFFVVARASPEGDTVYNEKLSRDRAQAVLAHLQERFKDPDIDKQVGLLWLGEEFAQLDQDFCTWSRSRGGECTAKEINRSSFIAWIDCAI
jgi:outer membrane protein OmpA-like peptidoglycan-associated protein